MKTFEMLVLDSGKKTRFDDALSLLYGFRSYSKLWNEPQLNESDLRIEDKTCSMSISDQGSKSGESTTKQEVRAFTIVLTGEYKNIENLRLPIVEFVSEQKFNFCYITKDEVSEQIACELYPYLYRLENSLRRYLTKFLTTRFGGEWWKLTVSQETSEKANKRKGNEIVFGKKIDNSSFLIDFEELGEFIFEQTTGFLTSENIRNRVMHLPENIDALKELKSELKSNYQKFFKETFADRDFKNKWKKWVSWRNKIAHTNLFTNDDLIEGKSIADELIQIIGDAEDSTNQPTVTQVEREAAQEQIIARTASESSSTTLDSERNIQDESGDLLTDDEFLHELKEQESFYSGRTNGFVGLVRFVRFHLTELGYSESESRNMLERLKREKKVEVYYVDNPYDSATQTAAIRCMKS